MGGRRFLGFGTVALAVALVAGCNGGTDDPTTSAPVSVEPTADATTAAVTVEPTDDPTPDPTPTDPWALGPPAVTLDMQYDTEEGAVAFVEFYVELTAYSFNHLDTTDLIGYADVNCVACNDTISSVETLVEGDYTVVGGIPTIVNIRSSVHYPDSDVYIVELDHSYTEAQLLNPDGTVARTEPATSGAAGYTVKYNGPNDWTMIAFGTIE